MTTSTQLPTLSVDQLHERLADVVQRIVEVCEPDRIVLFGSTARGDATPDSDLDVLVLKDSFSNRSQTQVDIYDRLYGVGVPVDVVLATLDEERRYRDTSFLVLCRALREGREVYHA